MEGIENTDACRRKAGQSTHHHNVIDVVARMRLCSFEPKYIIIIYNNQKRKIIYQKREEQKIEQ